MSEVKLTTGEPEACWEGQVTTPRLAATHTAWEAHHPPAHKHTHKVWLQMAWREPGWSGLELGRPLPCGFPGQVPTPAPTSLALSPAWSGSCRVPGPGSVSLSQAGLAAGPSCSASADGLARSSDGPDLWLLGNATGGLLSQKEQQTSLPDLGILGGASRAPAKS